jgi:PAS domain S-box-containing protein
MEGKILSIDQSDNIRSFSGFLTEVSIMVSKHTYEELERNDFDREHLYKSLFENNYSVMLLIDPETGAINDANPSACLFYGYEKDKLTNLKITDINTLSRKKVFMEMEKAKSEKRNYFNFKHRLSNGTIRDVEVFSGPIVISEKALLCSVIHDISERKSAEKERERLINELQNALSEVKILRGFLPICASCKKIRDDKGYWNQIESYIRDHSEAEFTHSICPKCAKNFTQA